MLKRSTIFHGAVAGVLACTLTMAPLVAAPSYAYADTSAELQSQLDEANAHLDEINEKLVEAGEALNDTNYQIEQTEAKISETEDSIASNTQKLADTRSALADRVAESYKTGGVSLLTIIFDSRSVDELISALHYAEKVADHDAAQIQQVKDLTQQLEDEKASLEKDKAAQQELADQQTQQQADLQQQVADQQDYVNSLSAEVQAAIKAEQEAERQRQIEAARQAQAEADAQAAQQAQQQAQQQSSNTNTGNSSSSTSNSSSSSSSSSGSTTVSSNARQIILAAARSCIGTPYVLGASTPGVAIDCSGLTQYAYAQAGLSIPHSSAAQRAMTTIKPISQCQAGDLVFWYGHVAIYAGNGMIIHATYTGACEQALYGSYLGGGCPFNI